MATATIPNTEDEPTVATPSIAATDASPFDPPLAPITVPMYLKILNAGILADERVYLWNGRLAPQMTTGRPHTTALMKTYHAFFDLGLPDAFPEQEQPMAFRLSSTCALFGRSVPYRESLMTQA